MFAILIFSLFFSSSNQPFKPSTADWLAPLTIDSLLLLYRENTAHQLSDESIIKRARKDYSEVVKNEFVRKPIPLQERLTSVIVNIDDVEYRLYGFTHDLNKKNCPPDYKTFVQKAVEFEISDGSTLVAEQCLSTQFGARAGLFLETPDHVFSPEVRYMLAFGSVVLSLANFGNAQPTTGLTRIEEYSLDVDVREGLNDRLPGDMEPQIFIRSLAPQDAVGIGAQTDRRSVFMAGFLKSLASARNKRKIAFFMGYDHLTVVRSCLENAGLCSERSEYLKGLVFGRANDLQLKQIVAHYSNLTNLFN